MDTGDPAEAPEAAAAAGSLIAAQVMLESGLFVRARFLYKGGRAGLVDSAREKNKARAVAEISGFI